MRKKATDDDLSFAACAEDAVSCFLMVLAQTPEFAKWWADTSEDQTLNLVLSHCLQEAKKAVTEDYAGFKIIK